MFEFLGTLLVGAIFGLALAAPPGPMNAIIAEESVIRGWVSGFKAGLGAMTADVLFFVLTLIGVVALLDEWSGIQPLFYLLGGGLMCYFALGAFEGAKAEFASGTESDGREKGFQKTFVLSITNPYQIGFWLTVGVGLIQRGSLDVFAHVPAVDSLLAGTLVVETGSPALLFGFFAGITVWIVVYPAALIEVGNRVDAVAPLVAGLSGLVLAGFGVLFLLVGLTSVT
ncbi:LysE family translocator [Halovivax gelatinilyticus]|uniref:LysE family translocator n=1 Tax=Halovivax gelatinilyticus TaxID=2961597 RepID=UPI0020CA7DFE|nr:LysE family transporter [Halovivax gelatinilyticus]